MMPLTTTPITSWIIEVYRLDGALVQNVSVSDPSSNSTIVSNLSPGTIYMVRVAGINTRGVGNYSEFATAQTYRGTSYTLWYFWVFTQYYFNYQCPTRHLKVQP